MTGFDRKLVRIAHPGAAIGIPVRESVLIERKSHFAAFAGLEEDLVEGFQFVNRTRIACLLYTSMQSNLKVVGDCTVREVLVCEGDPVATGQPLIKLDILTNDQNNE